MAIASVVKSGVERVVYTVPALLCSREWSRAVGPGSAANELAFVARRLLFFLSVVRSFLCFLHVLTHSPPHVRQTAAHTGTPSSPRATAEGNKTFVKQ